MLIGRKKEKEKLESLLASNESELVAIYGRRRVGKTFLIREVYKHKMAFELTGTYKGKTRDQLRIFHKQLKRHSTDYNPSSPPRDWFDAFDLLEKYLDGLKGKSKKVIFIDEFPWIASARSKFLMLFEHFWNTYCTKRKDLIVVVCGSAASFMVQKIIKNKGGLHGRISHFMQLLPFTLSETKTYLRSKNLKFDEYDILQLYMVVGGVPFYLSKIEKGLSVIQNVDRLCFEQGGALINEYEQALLSLFTNSEKHQLIIETLATNKKGITRNVLLTKCNSVDGGNFSKALTELVESGFVSWYKPYQKKKKGALYRLSDEYCLFYLKFMKDTQGAGVGTFEKLFAKQTFKSWSGFAFEGICLKHVEQIKRGLGVDRIYSINSSWANNDAQVDLVIDRDDRRINLCEMKFYSTEYTIDKQYSSRLRNKVQAFKEDTKTRKHVVITMVTTFGLKENEYSISLVENSLTMDILFE